MKSRLWHAYCHNKMTFSYCNCACITLWFLRTSLTGLNEWINFWLQPAGCRGTLSRLTRPWSSTRRSLRMSSFKFGPWTRKSGIMFRFNDIYLIFHILIIVQNWRHMLDVSSLPCILVHASPNSLILTAYSIVKIIKLLRMKWNEESICLKFTYFTFRFFIGFHEKLLKRLHSACIKCTNS